MLKETCSGWFLDVSGQVSTLEVEYFGGKCV